MHTAECCDVGKAENILWHTDRWMHRTQPAHALTQSQGLCCTKLWESVKPMAVMHVCICVHCLYACASFCICMHMHVCVLAAKVESRKGMRLDGWRGCLFIHYPAASVVSGGHGNTCLGPFSTGMFVACFGPAKAFSSHLLCSLLSSIPSFYFGSC